MKKYDLGVYISLNNDAITKKDRKCIKCGLCKKICSDEVTVARMFEINPKREPICINCGQCINVCPTKALSERLDYINVKRLLHSKTKKTIVFSIAPAVRVSLGEDLGIGVGVNIEKKIPTIIRRLGGDYAFDITFGADLTVMEEAMELVDRIKNKGILPQLSSCCPAWVKYCEIFYPELIPNLSSAKSPIAMHSTIIKTYFAKEKGLKPSDIVNIVIAPCTAKKSEINRKELSYTSKDTDYLLTTREFAKLIKDFKININRLKESEFDSPLQTGSGAGVIFGASGGVCEAVLRTAYYFITGKNLNKKDLVFKSIRGMEGVKEASITVDDTEIKVAVCNGMNNAKILIDNLPKRKYKFIEVMNCLGGCIGGGGQPKVVLPQRNKVLQYRMDALYDEDEEKELRLCHENPEIISIYNNYLKTPNSDIAKELLHTEYYDKSYLMDCYKK